jgi:hypothetical protein
MDGHRFNNSHIWNSDRLYEILYVLVCIHTCMYWYVLSKCWYVMQKMVHTPVLRGILVLPRLPAGRLGGPGGLLDRSPGLPDSEHCGKTQTSTLFKLVI